MYEPADLDLAAAISDSDTLGQCLERSPDVESGTLSIRQFRGYPSASLALNAALDSSRAAVVVIPHQDVYLPAEFSEGLARWLSELHRIDPDWAVVGCIGIDSSGVVQGETWSSGMGRLVGSPVLGPVEVVTVDEMILVVRTASGVRFDPHLPGFHLYGTDLTVSAAERGLRSYVVPMPVIHHSRPLVKLGRDYWRAYLHLRRRWIRRLPVRTMFGGIRKSVVHLARVDLDYRRRSRGRANRPERVGDPREIARTIGYEE